MAGTVSAMSNPGGSVHSRMEDEVYALHYDIVADASDASIPDQTISVKGVSLVAISVKFDATTPPDSLKVEVQDQFGIVIDSNTFTASGYFAIEPIKFATGPLTIVHTTNTTNSAKAKVVLTVL